MSSLRIPLGVAFFAMTFVWASACTPVSGGQPMVWPGAARLGDSIAMAVDSNYIPVPLQGLDRHDLSVDNVAVQVRQGSTTLATLSPRVVFDGMAAQGSIRAAFDPGIGISIVVLDPPRAGLKPNAVRALLLTGARTITGDPTTQNVASVPGNSVKAMASCGM